MLSKDLVTQMKKYVFSFSYSMIAKPWRTKWSFQKGWFQVHALSSVDQWNKQGNYPFRDYLYYRYYTFSKRRQSQCDYFFCRYRPMIASNAFSSSPLRIKEFFWIIPHIKLLCNTFKIMYLYSVEVLLILKFSFSFIKNLTVNFWHFEISTLNNYADYLRFLLNYR